MIVHNHENTAQPAACAMHESFNFFSEPIFRTGVMPYARPLSLAQTVTLKKGGFSKPKASSATVTIRKEFPESWIWEGIDDDG